MSIYIHINLTSKSVIFQPLCLQSKWNKTYKYPWSIVLNFSKKNRSLSIHCSFYSLTKSKSFLKQLPNAQNKTSYTSLIILSTFWTTLLRFCIAQSQDKWTSTRFGHCLTKVDSFLFLLSPSSFFSLYKKLSPKTKGKEPIRRLINCRSLLGSVP